MFFSAMPPKASTTSVCATICSQATLRRATSSMGAQHMRQDDGRGTRAVAVDRAHVAAQRQCSGSGAPGSARGGSARRWTSRRSRRRRPARRGVLHALQFGGHAVQHLVPGHGHEPSRPRCGSGPGPCSSQPRRTIGRATRAGAAAGRGQVVDQRVGVGVVGCGRTCQLPSVPAQPGTRPSGRCAASSAGPRQAASQSWWVASTASTEAPHCPRYPAGSVRRRISSSPSRPESCAWPRMASAKSSLCVMPCMDAS
jgi:hypothetical protein